MFISSSLLAGDSWPIGKWNMLDDFTELPEAIIQISALKTGGFEGKIIEVFPDPEDDPVDVCKPCVGVDKNKPIITCCASGMRSAAAKNILKSNGYQTVYNGGSWASLKHQIQ